ncbi:MAG TPA: hypothetical protein VIH59_22220 [Candidatus Tectomicrobia bacterium]|jgi:hypothetical protein
MTVKPDGFCHLEAILATTLVGARPTEKVKPISGVQVLFDALGNTFVGHAQWAPQAGEVGKTLVHAFQLCRRMDRLILRVGRFEKDLMAAFPKILHGPLAIHLGNDNISIPWACPALDDQVIAR